MAADAEVGGGKMEERFCEEAAGLENLVNQFTAQEPLGYGGSGERYHLEEKAARSDADTDLEAGTSGDSGVTDFYSKEDG